MLLRLAVAIALVSLMGAGGYAAKTGALEEYTVGSRVSATEFGSGSKEYTGLASVDGSRGAKFVSVAPKEEPPAPEPSWSDKLLAMIGLAG